MKVKVTIFAVWGILFLIRGSLAQEFQPYTGVYASGNDRLSILQRIDSVILFQLYLKGDNSDGQTAGWMKLRGMKSFYHVSGDWVDSSEEPCSLNFIFENNRITISQTGYMNCGYGQGITANGTYLKIKGALPDFKSRVGNAYEMDIKSARAYFYDDSSLTYRLKSYLIKGDKFLIFKETPKAIFTVFFDKHHKTYTEGWISKVDAE